MPNTPETISTIRIGNEDFQIDAVTVNGRTLPDESRYMPTVSAFEDGKILMVLNGQWGLSDPGDLYEDINGIDCGDSGIDYETEYLTLDILEDGTVKWNAFGSNSAKTIQYSINDGEWMSITSSNAGVTINVSTGDKVRLKGTNTTYATSNANLSGFGGKAEQASTGTASFNVYGNIMSLVYGDNFIGQTTLTGEYNFCSLFDSSNIVSAEHLILPAMTLTPHCYRALFSGCKSLITAPALPATTLAESCYRYMFNVDTLLTTAPELPALVIPASAYYGLFNGCSSLNYIKCLATDRSASSATTNWVLNVAPIGTFIKNPNMTGWPLNSSQGIPVGWNVFNDGDEIIIVSEPVISYENNTITITCSMAGTTIYYRLNQEGSYQPYSAPVVISGDTIVEAYAVVSGVHSATVSEECQYVAPVIPDSGESEDSDSSDYGDSDSEGSEPIIPPHDYSLDYLTFDILTSGTILWDAEGSNATKTIQYSINDGEWTSVTSKDTGEAISVTAGDSVRFKGTNTRYCNGNKSNYSRFGAGTATFNVSGNIMSMTAGDNFANVITLPAAWTFTQFFKESKPVSAENLILPADTMLESCYRAMFSKCTTLVTPPALPATTLATYCYYYMFENCGITTAPDLLATTIPSNGYAYMFTGCSNLNYIKCLATDKSASNSLTNWVNNVAASGTFVKDSDTSWTTGISGIPTGWTVENYVVPPEPEPVYEITREPLLTSSQVVDPWFYNGNRVELPYSVNAIDGHSGSYLRRSDFQFTSTLELEAIQPTYLWFNHADQSADIYVDDTLVTTHWGGYTAFFTDITNYVHTGTNNLKVVLNNTARNALAPSDGDFNFNATLGEVEVLSSPVLPDKDYGYDGFHITSTVSDASATVTVTTKVPATATIICTISGTNCNYTDTQTDTGVISFTTTINNPHLWNGTLDPYLYTVTLQIYHNGTLYHTLSRKYGLRYYSYVYNETGYLPNNEAYTGFLLNGEPYQLRGVCMHDDLEGKANALSAEDIDNDFEIIQELGCNFIRLAHYPHPKEVYDHCDELGIIVQTEGPCVKRFNSPEVSGTNCPQEYYDHLYIQYEDMVRHHYNHPCILFWGLFNEATTNDTSWAKTQLEAYRTFIKGIDPERWVGYVISHSYNNPSSVMGNPDMDWYGCNIYVGWYINNGQNNGTLSNDPTSQLNTRISNIITNKHKPLAFSEYGCGGNQSCHSVDPFETTQRGNFPRHDIEYMMWLHEGHIAAIKDKPELLFTGQWQLFDIAVNSRQEGYKVCLDGVNVSDDNSYKYLNDKGLVMRDHITKKDPFYLYKAWWNTTDIFTHICGKNYIKNVDRVIKCYTNDDGPFNLYINNVLVDTKTATDHIVEFDQQTFSLNDVVRVTGDTTQDTFTFTAIAPPEE